MSLAYLFTPKFFQTCRSFCLKPNTNFEEYQ